MNFVYAIAFIDTEFVMVHNKKRSWEMPGGGIRAGETPESAIIREFREETGMSFVPIDSVSLSDGVVFFGLAMEAEYCPTNEIVQVGLFSDLPEELSFSRDEYEIMLQRGREVLKNYINSEDIGELLQSGQLNRN